MWRSVRSIGVLFPVMVIASSPCSAARTFTSLDGRVLLSSQFAAQAPRSTDADSVSEVPPEILLKRGFWGTKFTFDGSEPAKVHVGIGTYDKRFKEVMGLHPQALRTAKHAYTYNVLSFICATGFAVVSAVEFAATVRKAEEVQRGNMVDTGMSAKQLVLPLSLATGMAIFSAIGKSHLVRGVREFNVLQRQAPRRLNDLPERRTR